jgi:alpha-glucosidase
MEGLYTPRYETYNISIIGLPFKPARINADGKEIKDFTFGKDKVLNLILRKNFAHLVID